MAWSQSDLDKLSEALAAGIQRVRYSDGREVTYQTTADMLKVRDQMKAELAAAASQINPRRRFSVGRFCRS